MKAGLSSGTGPTVLELYRGPILADIGAPPPSLRTVYSWSANALPGLAVKPNGALSAERLLFADVMSGIFAPEAIMGTDPAED